MSEQVKRYKISTNLRPEAIAFLPDEVVSGHDYDALHAEAEALRVALLGIASVNPAERGIEWAKSYASDGLKGSGSELYARWLDAFNEAEALRAENGQLRENNAAGLRVSQSLLASVDRADSRIGELENELEALRSQLEAARGLLRKSKDGLDEFWMTTDEGIAVVMQIDAFLTATSAPEVQACVLGGTGISASMKGAFAEALAERGERQEAVAWETRCNTERRFSVNQCSAEERAEHWRKNGRGIVEVTPLYYATPQPGPDVRGLAAFALELIDGAWEGGSLDGGDIQEAGVRHRLLVVEQRQESCGEHCDCAEYGFPSECYRLTPALAAHRQAQQGGSHD